MDKIQERIQEAIKKSGLSYRKLAEKIGSSSTSIYRYVHKDVDKIPLSAIQKIAEVTETNVEWLMGWDDESKKEENDLGAQLITLLASMSEEEKQKAIEYIKFIQSQKK